MEMGRLALDKTAKKIYWIDYPSTGDKVIRRADLTGANVETIHTFADQTTYYRLCGIDSREGGRLYWHAWKKNIMYSTDKNGGFLSAILSTGTSSTYLGWSCSPTLDTVNDRLVWMNGTIDKYFSIGLSGGLEAILTRQARP